MNCCASATAASPLAEENTARFHRTSSSPEFTQRRAYPENAEANSGDGNIAGYNRASLFIATGNASNSDRKPVKLVNGAHATPRIYRQFPERRGRSNANTQNTVYQ